jgi:hypothetical protein
VPSDRRRSVRCRRCGSRRLRRSHAPRGWRRLVRRLTPLRRYACGTCGFRGWTLARIGTHPPASPAILAPPLEARDLRRDYARRRQLLRTVVFAATLGAAAGYAILRGGGS